jgi:formylglycine-generating enzyme required for sulfatase activity
MRLLPLILLMLTGTLLASEPSYPLWDGHESIADYAKRVNLPPTKTLDLDNGVKLELVLIPAGRFIMGTPEPAPVDEDGFNKKIVTGQVLLAFSGTILLVYLAIVVIQSIRQRRRPQFSLARLLTMVAAAGGCVLSSLHWRQSAQKLKAAQMEYAVTKARFDSADQAEKPACTVTLSMPFYMGKFAVTQEQYQQITGATPSLFKGKDNPVEWVTWDDAQKFCSALTKATKLEVRLPTEAEWEYACRAGTTTNYYSGDQEADLARIAWYVKNSGNTTHPVGQKEPNAFGLYDMCGNVWQWCQDWFAEDYYRRSESESPQGPAQGEVRMCRGGSWDYSKPWYLRSAYRGGREQGTHSYVIGFRVVATVSRAQ